jgi:D-3-phosphoglycerate dehydrogenase / 2-oxoglutarate reductase
MLGYAKRGMAMLSLFGESSKKVLILNAEPKGYSEKAHNLLLTLGEVLFKECNEDELLSIIPKVDILIVRLGHKIDNELMSKAKRLKVIVTATTGLNHINLNAARKYGIKILSLKGEREFLDTLTATAELTWSLLLSLYRRIPAAVGHVGQGGWNRDLFKGRQLKGKTLGIIGFGRLGSIVSQYGKAFQMNVITFDPFVDDVPGGVNKVGLIELLQASDVVSLHVNYEESNHQMLNKDMFQYIKPGSVLINTSRGELIDEKSMLNALDSKILSGVALDVLYGEAEKTRKWLQNSELWKRSLKNDNIIIVPHIGGATFESMEDTEIFMANKLNKFLDRGVINEKR